MSLRLTGLITVKPFSKILSGQMGTLIVTIAEYRMLPNVPSNDVGKSSGSWHVKLYLYTSAFSVIGSPGLRVKR